MPLTLYRRHTATCPIALSQISARLKRQAMACECPIWMYGRSGNSMVPRQSTGLFDLRAAEALRNNLIAKTKDEVVHGPRIADCINSYIASRNHELREMTKGQYLLVLGRLQTYCESRGIYFMQELSVDLLETFKTEGFPDVTDTSKVTWIGKLRCFLKDAFRRGWIAESLAEKVRGHRAQIEPKEPFTKQELDLVLNEAMIFRGRGIGYAKYPKTFRLLLELMLETGMRVGDATQFDPSRLVRGEHMWVYTFAMQKQRRIDRPRSIEVYVTDRLQAMIRGCEWFSVAKPFTYDSRGPKYFALKAYHQMQRIGKYCGVADCRPHRLRDTFAVNKLLAGLQLEDVSRLLGHSSVKVTEQYYSRWTSSRRQRLERLVSEAVSDPRDN